MIDEITPEILRQLLDYNPETGVLVWRERADCFFKPGRQGQEWWAAKWNRENAGKEAGIGFFRTGHKKLKIFNKTYAAHRVAWAIYYGSWPVIDIDHIDRCKTNNRILNMREADDTVNNINKDMRNNNTSGKTGVSFHRGQGKWFASIGFRGEKKFLGSFCRFEDAVSARRDAERRYGFDLISSGAA